MWLHRSCSVKYENKWIFLKLLPTSPSSITKKKQKLLSPVASKLSSQTEEKCASYTFRACVSCVFPQLKNCMIHKVLAHTPICRSYHPSETHLQGGRPGGPITPFITSRYPSCRFFSLRNPTAKKTGLQLNEPRSSRSRVCQGGLYHPSMTLQLIENDARTHHIDPLLCV